MMHKLVRIILRFIIQHKKIYRIFNKWKWFRTLCYEETQAVIGNIPRMYNLNNIEQALTNKERRDRNVR